MIFKDFLINELKAQKGHLPTICRKAGVKSTTAQNWVTAGVEPTITNAEKVLNALGYTIAIESISEMKSRVDLTCKNLEE